MHEPLVWLPFDVADLGEVPAGLRFETVTPDDFQDPPASVSEVEFFVPDYGFSANVGAVLPQMTNLQVIQALSAGVDHLRPVLPDGVTLCTGRGIHDAATAEMTVALALASLRGIPTFVRAQSEHRWAPEFRQALADKRVLIIGAGAIGAAIEARLLPFEVEVVKVARSARGDVHGFDEIPELLGTADVVVLVVPLTEQTRGMVDDAFLSRMKDDSLLINVARGPVVDNHALLNHLGRIHAALDVVDPEPLPADDPLWQAPNLLITPHVAGGTSAMHPRAMRLVREQLARFVAGEGLINQVAGNY